MKTTGATRGVEDRTAGCVLHVALELDDEGWKLAFGRELSGRAWLRRVRPRDREAVLREIRAAKRRFGLEPDARV